MKPPLSQLVQADPGGLKWEASTAPPPNRFPGSIFFLHGLIGRWALMLNNMFDGPGG